MRKAFTLFLVLALMLNFTSIVFAGSTLDEVLNNTENKENIVEEEILNGENNGNTEDIYRKNQGFIDGLKKASDISTEVEGVESLTSEVKTIVAFIVQVLSYLIILLLALRIIIDLAFIALPFIRSFLGNSYIGNTQAGAGGLPNSMNMGGALGGNINSLNRMANMQNNSLTSPDQQPGATGRIQWISNAALNAIAGENTVGPDGKAVSPFKLYVKDMIIVLIMVPILITLGVTGALSELGFLIAQVIVEGITKIGELL